MGTRANAWSSQSGKASFGQLSAAYQVVSFPDRHRRQVELALGIFDLTPNLTAEFLRPGEGPNPDVGVEQEVHFRPAGHPLKAPTGPTMSPETSTDSLMQPSQDGFGEGAGGRISATGLPKRVTRTGVRVRRTSASTARQVALNFEIAISCMTLLYHSQRP